MKVINYDKLLKAHRTSGYISEEANCIANTLLCELCLQAGSGLARYLGVDICFDNHMALRVWVQKRLEAQESYLIDEMCSQLETELYGLLPNTEHGF